MRYLRAVSIAIFISLLAMMIGYPLQAQKGNNATEFGNTTNLITPANQSSGENVSKITTTLGNATSGITVTSQLPPKQKNATDFFPPDNKVAIVKGAALKREKAFQPNPVNVKAGGTVTWTNEDTVTHTVTSGKGFSGPNMGKEFDSGLLGTSFTHKFTNPGTFPYFCQVHPTMIGSVVVK
jgi:plastocyanin